MIERLKVCCQIFPGCGDPMVDDPAGEYVRHADHEATVGAIEELLVEAKRERDELQTRLLDEIASAERAWAMLKKLQQTGLFGRSVSEVEQRLLYEALRRLVDKDWL